MECEHVVLYLVRLAGTCYFVASKPVISGVALQLIASLCREIQIAACEKSIFDSSILFEEIKNISPAPMNELRRDSQKKV